MQTQTPLQSLHQLSTFLHSGSNVITLQKHYRTTKGFLVHSRRYGTDWRSLSRIVTAQLDVLTAKSIVTACGTRCVYSHPVPAWLDWNFGVPQGALPGPDAFFCASVPATYRLKLKTRLVGAKGHRCGFLKPEARAEQAATCSGSPKGGNDTSVWICCQSGVSSPSWLKVSVAHFHPASDCIPALWTDWLCLSPYGMTQMIDERCWKSVNFSTARKCCCLTESVRQRSSHGMKQF